MSTRIFVIDQTIIEQINMGHAGVANVVRNLFDAGATFYIPTEDWKRLSTDADRALTALAEPEATPAPKKNC